MKWHPPRSATLSDQAYVELVRSLFDTLPPSLVMSALFVMVAALSVRTTGDIVSLVLAAVGTALSIWRVAVVILCRSRGVELLVADRSTAARYERAFAVPYVSFAVVLGLFGARAMALPIPGVHMVVAALLVGYAAGVAAGISLRPRIGVTSMLAAVVPTALASLARWETFHVALTIVLLALFAGGLQSMRARYAGELDKIELRRTIDGLARRDHLTGLANRLELSDRFDEAMLAARPGSLAIHCLDLDRFKPVNDRHGHLFGDELLRQVAERLRCSLRGGDLACRFGGDEFVVMQCAMTHPDEADLLARRLTRSLGEPYRIGDRVIRVSASIGYVVSRSGDTLGDLLARADNALYAVKALGGGAAAPGALDIGEAIVELC